LGVISVGWHAGSMQRGQFFSVSRKKRDIPALHVRSYLSLRNNSREAELLAGGQNSLGRPDGLTRSWSVINKHQLEITFDRYHLSWYNGRLWDRRRTSANSRGKIWMSVKKPGRVWLRTWRTKKGLVQSAWAVNCYAPDPLTGRARPHRKQFDTKT